MHWRCSLFPGLFTCLLWVLRALFLMQPMCPEIVFHLKSRFHRVFCVSLYIYPPDGGPECTYVPFFLCIYFAGYGLQWRLNRRVPSRAGPLAAESSRVCSAVYASDRPMKSRAGPVRSSHLVSVQPCTRTRRRLKACRCSSRLPCGGRGVEPTGRGAQGH